MRNTYKYLLGTVALVSAALVAMEAGAGGFALREQSAVGAGDSFAGEGTTSMGLSAMFWNPAAVTQEQNIGFEVHSSVIMPTSTRFTNFALTTLALQAIEPSNGRHDMGWPGFVPNFYGAAMLTPNWFVGLAIDTPYGLTTDQGGRGQASQELGNHAAIFSVEANPILGYKFNDVVSIAAGPRVTYLQAVFNRSLFALPPFMDIDSPVETDLSDVGFGFTAGITVKPLPGTEFSLGYRSQEHLKLAGQDIFAPNPALAIQPNFAPFNGITAHVTSSETLPDQVNFGVSQRINDTFRLLGTAEWTHWSLLQAVPITFTSGPAPGTTADTFNFFFRDGWFFSLGGEYRWDPQTTLRAGIGYEISPVVAQFRDINLPDSNNLRLSGGITHYIGKGFTLDFAYSYIWYQDAPIFVGPGNPDQVKLLTLIPGVFNTYAGDVTTHKQVVSLALRKEFVPDVIVTKY
jgi:long-chain fatty acid transport protein